LGGGGVVYRLKRSVHKWYVDFEFKLCLSNVNKPG
jgi:hypothetical protein